MERSVKYFNNISNDENDDDDEQTRWSMVESDAGKMSMSEDAKQNAWAEHYERLLNVEFDWDPDRVSNEPQLEGLHIPITTGMVKLSRQQVIQVQP